MGTIRVTIDEVGDGRTRMSIASIFPSTEAMEQVLAMGMEEGLTQAVGQIDAILAENAVPLGLRTSEVAVGRSSGYAQPVTSHRRPLKRRSISPSRTRISAPSAAHTPTTPQSKASAASESVAQTTKATTIDHAR